MGQIPGSLVNWGAELGCVTVITVGIVRWTMEIDMSQSMSIIYQWDNDGTGYEMNIPLRLYWIHENRH